MKVAMLVHRILLTLILLKVKKLIFPVVALVVVLAGSCSKDSQTVSNDSAGAVSKGEAKPYSSPTFPSTVMYGGKFRKVVVYKGEMYCWNEEENCHPTDIVITAPRLYALDVALAEN